ncbi:MAG: domain containing protein [Actinomycetia bacterium]|nr:domain containing protein [Actinomycetes bacterium]
MNEQPPPPEPVEPFDYVDHTEIAYDLSDWSSDKRRSIEFLLSNARIAYLWENGLLYVSHAHQDAVDDMVDTLEEDEPLEFDDDPDAGGIEERRATGHDQVDEREHIAGPGRRFVGFLVDGFAVQLVWWAVLFVIARQSDSLRNVTRTWWLGALVIDVYIVSAVALWGQTLGKLAAGTRVVAFDDGSLPGWRRSIIRFLVPAAPSPLLFLLRRSLFVLGPLVSLAWTIVVYVGVFTDRYRRGLHDRAAGTVVIDTDYRRPRRSPIVERLARGQRLG